jgi:hypothetical protein
MRDIFHDAASGSEKKRNCPKADKERKFSTEDADEPFSAFCFTIRFRLSRHGREHIESASTMQSVRTRSLSRTISRRCVSSVASWLHNMNDRISVSPDEAICVRKD